MNTFEKVSLGLFPTPLYHLENVSRELGTNVWIKRDDATPSPLPKATKPSP